MSRINYKEFQELIKAKNDTNTAAWALLQIKESIKVPPMVQPILDRLCLPENYTHSSFASVNKIRTLLKNISIDAVNYVCTVFSATTKNGMTSNYGFLYSISHENNLKTELFHVDNPSPVSHKWYCCSPAPVSQDGEYRARFNRMSTSGGQFIVEQKYPRIYKDIEEHIVRKIEDEKMKLNYEIFLPYIDANSETITKAIDNSILVTRLQIKFLIIYWLVEISLLSRGLQEKHINPKINHIYFQNIKADINFFKELCKTHGQADVMRAVIYSSETVVHKAEGTEIIPEVRKFALGQKLRPLNVNETQDPFNVKYPPWRELYISQLCTNLVVDLICPSFPILINWFYIKNSRPGLFDNEPQYRRLEFSERSNMVVKKLRDAQSMTYHGSSKESDDSKTYLSDMFEQLYGKIEDPIDFTKSTLMMSNVTLGFVNESVGRTFFDIPNLAKSVEWVHQVGDILKDHDIFKKHIWDLCYASYCLFVIRCIHFDLHLNNCTINNYTLTELDEKKQYSILSNVDGYWWQFRTKNNNYSYIIDNSRTIIDPDSIRDHKFFKNNEEAFIDFVDDQNNRITAKLCRLFPTTIRPMEADLRRVLVSHFSAIFNVMCVIDIFEVARHMLKYYEDIAVKPNLALLNKIVQVSEHHLTNVLMKVIQNPDMKTEQPILAVMKECFIDNLIDITKPVVGDICDIWIARPPAHDTTTYAGYPVWLKNEKELINGKAKHSKYYEYMDKHKKKIEVYRDKALDMVEFIAERHRLKYN